MVLGGGGGGHSDFFLDFMIFALRICVKVKDTHFTYFQHGFMYFNPIPYYV